MVVLEEVLAEGVDEMVIPIVVLVVDLEEVPLLDAVIRVADLNEVRVKGLIEVRVVDLVGVRKAGGVMVLLEVRKADLESVDGVSFNWAFRILDL